MRFDVEVARVRLGRNYRPIHTGRMTKDALCTHPPQEVSTHFYTSLAKLLSKRWAKRAPRKIPPFIAISWFDGSSAHPARLATGGGCANRVVSRRRSPSRRAVKVRERLQVPLGTPGTANLLVRSFAQRATEPSVLSRDVRVWGRCRRCCRARIRSGGACQLWCAAIREACASSRAALAEQSRGCWGGGDRFLWPQVAR